MIDLDTNISYVAKADCPKSNKNFGKEKNDFIDIETISKTHILFSLHMKTIYL